jgi:hypothetical protein
MTRARLTNGKVRPTEQDVNHDLAQIGISPARLLAGLLPSGYWYQATRVEPAR